MIKHPRSKRISCAYALLFTISACVIMLDPVQHRADAARMLADVQIPTPKTFKTTSVPSSRATAVTTDRLAHR